MVNIGIHNTMTISIFLQLITIIINLFVLFKPVSGINILLNQLLIFEFIVQFIEIIFYSWMTSNLSIIKNITQIRYYDWMITTPTMLVTLIIYLIYLKLSSESNDHQISKNFNNDFTDNKEYIPDYNAWELLLENKYTIFIILCLNWVMLLFGYLGEIKFISTNMSVLLGFIPFLIYYYLIYIYYAQFTSSGITIFYYFFIVWGTYGIAALLPYKMKNIFYNFLDLLSKNFFGLFLSYKLFYS